jgi:hypothetical protein
MSRSLLVLVKHLDDLSPARALVAALPERKFVLSFASEDLRTRFGECVHEATTDPFAFVLAPERIGLVLCFSGTRDLSLSSNFLLLNYFEEIGVPTVELQRDLLRNPKRAAQDSVARHYVAWSGQDGCGYLVEQREAETQDEPEGPVRDDVVLVTSYLAGPFYSEEQRYQFAFAVMRLAREYPQLCFLWRSSPAEEQNGDARLLLAMLGSSGPTNLFLEENEPVAALLDRAGAVVTMAQTALLDYAAAKKPALIYVNGDLAAELDELHFASFTAPEELLTRFRALRSEPSSFAIESRVPRLSPDRLRATLTRIEQEWALKNELREVMLRYLAYMQDVRARSDVGRLSPQLNALEKRLGELEKQLVAQREKQATSERAKPADAKNGKRPLSVAQKAWKLAREVRKRALKP